MLKRAIPVLHVSNAAAAERFYCDCLGFKPLFASSADPLKPDPCYVGLAREGAILHVSSFSGDGVAGGVANVLVDEVDAVHGELVAKSVPIAMAPTDQTWGSREMYVKDSDGNTVRFIQPSAGAIVSLFPPALTLEAIRLLKHMRAGGLKLATAESCTGGLIAGLFTEIAGSSDVMECGFVTYSNEAKAELLGVPAGLIAQHGAVSEPVARAMAEGALARAHADIAVAITGIAGPGGGSAAKPVGLVHVAAVRKGGEVLHRECRFGDISRGSIRLMSVEAALQLISRAAGASVP
ncbi:MAG: nicotinamide-nucleotide amidohydrolase family protein [Hyphomonadaceae bacterium]|nr:nicotinamide-nucleotide amidohydrolase family protein [Hyphomonadaceae bacterium]